MKTAEKNCELIPHAIYNVLKLWKLPGQHGRWSQRSYLENDYSDTTISDYGNFIKFYTTIPMTFDLTGLWH